MLVLGLEFLSTLSLRRATFADLGGIGKKNISIHALLAESDRQNPGKHYVAFRFLSTLSLRRATFTTVLHWYHMSNFYPRSPCGERPSRHQKQYGVFGISIHALLAESDSQSSAKSTPEEEFLSTLSLRRATTSHFMPKIGTLHFYPRSPCGERRTIIDPEIKIATISIHALLAESDALGAVTSPAVSRFLSTLSLRRATVAPVLAVGRAGYFYPRSPCGERHHRFRRWPIPRDNFYPRSPCGERRPPAPPMREF